MAWRCSSVEAFLKKQSDLSPEALEEIKTRMTEVATADGIFSALQLDVIMGKSELARAYEKAWETDADLHM